MKKSRTFRKSFVAAIAALCLAAPLAVMPMTVSAYTITVKSGDATSTLSYDAYQIFSGVYNNGVLGSIQWGSGIDQDKENEGVNVLGAIKAITVNSGTDTNPFSTCTSANDVALILGNYTQDNNEVVKSFAKVVADYLSTTKSTSSSGVINVDAVGYYLVQNSGTVTGNDSATRNILKVVSENVAVSIKTSVPSIEKKVQENTTITIDDSNNVKGTEYENQNYNDVADYNIGDDVPFLDIGTLPSDLDAYDEYFYQIVDTPGENFTPNIGVSDTTVDVNTENANDVTVKIDGKTVNPNDVVVEYEDTNNDGKKDIVVTFKDIKNVRENDNNGNTISVTPTSKVTVAYTATLDKSADIGKNGQTSEVYLNFSNNPNEDYTLGSNEPTGKGTTRPDKVIVFTYELDITKQLKSGNSEAANLNEARKAGFILKNTNNNKFAKVNEDGTIAGWVDGEINATIVYNDATGLVKFVGLDDGTYTLIESVVPTGYNKMEDKTIEIVAAAGFSQTWSGNCDMSSVLIDLELRYDNQTGNASNLNDGKLDMTVINQKGSSLPSTGGIGTTIFYLGGGTMAAVAGVYLITKKRMKNEEDDEI